MEKRQQELQFLGFFGILKESFRLILSKPKLFTQITLTFILPLSIILHLHQYFSSAFSSKGFIYSILREFSYCLIFLIPFLLSTSAIVCAITFLYTAKDVTFKKIRRMLPKIWKRVMITFALSVAIQFCYGNLIGRVVDWIVQLLTPEQANVTDILNTKYVTGTVILFLYMAGYVYMELIQNLATVVSVVEDLSGIKAMIKSKNLLKGKIGVAFFLWLVFRCFYAVIDNRISNIFRRPDDGLNWRNGVGIGIPFFISLHSMVSLHDFVVETVIYFSCKAHEVTMRVLTTQSHQTNFKSIWWSVLDPLME